MTEQQQTDKLVNIQDIIKLANTNTESYASHYWIPSLKREVRFKDINTAQQKKLVKSIIDSPVFNTEFIFTINDIIKDNCVDPTVNVTKLTIIDKLVIALGLRISCIGNTIKVRINEDGDVPEGAEESIYVLDLTEIYRKLKDSVQIPDSVEVSDKTFTVTCNVPTLLTESSLEYELRGKGAPNFNVNSAAELRETIGDAFISEVVKYVDSVSIVSEESTQVIDWQKLKFKERIQVVECFSSQLLSKILDFINSVKTEIDKVEVYSFIHEGKKHERRLSITGDFFTIS